MGVIAVAVKDKEFTQVCQPISGYPVGWSRKPLWRVEVMIGSSWFLSKKTYASEKSAKSAAKRIMGKSNDQ